MSDDPELAILVGLRDAAMPLLASDDPLMASQYRHLFGRITALIAAKGGDGPQDQTRSGDDPDGTEETNHAAEGQGRADHGRRIGPG
jgi:hypothetical protein